MKTLAEAGGRTGWQVHAWCLLGNHFHLVVETPRGNLVVGITELLQMETPTHVAHLLYHRREGV